MAPWLKDPATITKEESRQLPGFKCPTCGASFTRDDWFGLLKFIPEVQKPAEDYTKMLIDAIKANQVFHTPYVMRCLGRDWNEYEIDAIKRSREALNSE